MITTFGLRCCTPPFVMFAFSSAHSVLGRSPRCEIIVNHQTISRRHAEFDLSDASAIVRDLGSLNGTFLAGKRIEMGSISPGMVVQFGSVAFEFTSDPESQEQTKRYSADGRPVPAEALFAETLSTAQARVFRLLIRGEQEKVIALKLSLSPHTVHNHIRAIFGACHVHSKAELIAKFLSTGDEKARVGSVS